MKYTVTNTSSATTIWVDGSYGGGNVPLSPGQTRTVTDKVKDILLLTYPTIVTVVGPAVDEDVPVQKIVTTPTSWTLVTLDQYCQTFKFSSVTAGIQISFSGWNSPATTPPAGSIIDLPNSAYIGGDAFFEIKMTANLTKEIYVKGTAGTELLTIIGY